MNLQLSCEGKSDHKYFFTARNCLVIAGVGMLFPVLGFLSILPNMSMLGDVGGWVLYPFTAMFIWICYVSIVIVFLTAALVNFIKNILIKDELKTEALQDKYLKMEARRRLDEDRD